MTRGCFLSLALAAALAACAPSGDGGGGGASRLPGDALDKAIAAAIGDPTTCVLLAARDSGKIVYRYGEAANCARALPACDRPGELSATAALALARAPDVRAASCPSSADGARTVGWAQGAVAGRRSLVYSAVMEGQRALPGREMSARLDQTFAQAGL